MAKQLEFSIIARNLIGQGLNQARSALQGFVSSVKGYFVNFAAAASFGAIVAGIKSIVDSAGQLKDAAEAAGVGVETFQTLGVYARETGMRADRLNTVMQRFRDIKDGIGSDKAAQKAIEGMGMSVRGLMNASNEDGFAMLMEAIAKTDNVDAAGKLFGKAGAQVVELAKALGSLEDAKVNVADQIMSEAEIAQLDRASKKLERFGATFRSVMAETITAGDTAKGNTPADNVKNNWFRALDPVNSFKVAQQIVTGNFENLFALSGNKDEGDAASANAKRNRAFRRRDRFGKMGASTMSPNAAAATNPADIMTDEVAAKLAEANQKLLDATGTLEERMQARVKLATEEAAIAADTTKLADVRAEAEIRIAGLKVEMAGIQKEIDQKAADAADALAAKKKQSLEEQEKGERDLAQVQRRAADEQRNAVVDRLRSLNDLGAAASSETQSRYDMAMSQAEEAFQGFMDPERFRAQEEAKQRRADAEAELQDTVKWMGNKPRDWMSDKEKAAADVMSAREEAAAAAVVLGLIEQNTKNLDKKIEQLLAMKG